MTHRKQVDVLKRPLSGELYFALIQSAAPLATMFGVIIRSDKVIMAPHAADLLTRLAPYLIRIERVAEWPGTRLAGSRTSFRQLYRLTPGSLAVVLAATDDLFAWVNPEMPEDIHLLRADGSTVLGSVAQEDAAWLELDEDELHGLLASAAPVLRDAFAS